MKINFKIKLLSVILFLMFFFCATISSVFGSAQPQSYTINIAQYQTGVDFPGYRMAEYFKSKVEELSGGRITVKHYPGDLLGDWLTQQIAVKEGSLDMTMAPPTASFDPQTEFTVIPYLAFSLEGARKILGPGGEAEELLTEIYKRNNAHYMGIQPGGFINIVSNKKFTPLPGDPSIKGVKTRVMQTKLEEKTIQTLGFQTLSMPWGEIHSALMLGTINAASGPAFSEAPLFKDVVKYHYNYQYSFAAPAVIINLALWESLSTEDQEILETAMTEAVTIEWDRALEAQKAAIEEMKEAGVEIVELTPEQMGANVALCRDVVWKWLAENVYGEELMNTLLGFAEPIPE